MSNPIEQRKQNLTDLVFGEGKTSYSGVFRGALEISLAFDGGAMIVFDGGAMTVPAQIFTAETKQVRVY